MPLYNLSSPKTGQTYRVNLEADPTDDDVDEITSQLDTEYYQQEGLDPSIAEQGPVGSIVNQVRNVGPAWLGGAMSNTGRILDAASEGVARLTGTERGGFFNELAEAGDKLQEEGRRLRPTNPANTTANTIGSGLQQALGMVATMGAAAPFVGTRAAVSTVPLVQGAIMGGGEGVQTARDLGIDNPAGQLATGAAFAASEMLTERLGGVGGKPVAEAIQRGLSTTLRDAGKTVLSESVEEPISGAVQEGVTRVAGGFVEDPNRPGFTVSGAALPTMEGFAGRRVQEAIGGAAGGTVFAGLQLAAGQGRTATGAEARRPGQHPALPPALPQDQEDLGDLTAEDVADLEQDEAMTPPARQPLQPILGDVPDRVQEAGIPAAAAPATAEESSAAAPERRLPILSNEPDRAALFRDNPFAVELSQEGDVRARIPLANPQGAELQTDTALPLEGQGFEEDQGFAIWTDEALNAKRDEYQALTKAADEEVEANAAIIRRAKRKFGEHPLEVRNAELRAQTGRLYVDGGYEQIQLEINRRRWEAGRAEREERNAQLDRQLEAMRPQREKEFNARAKRIEAFQRLLNTKVGETVQNADGKTHEVIANTLSKAALNRAITKETRGPVWMEHKQADGKTRYLAFVEVPDQRAAQAAVAGTAEGSTLPGNESSRNADLEDPRQAAGGGDGALSGPTGQTAPQAVGFRNLTPKGQAGAGGFVNAEVLAEARDLVLGGLRDFATWSRAMIQRFGEAIRSSLAEIWQRVLETLPTNAAQNVRLGRAQGAAPVAVSAGGFVNVPGAAPAAAADGRETQSRFASPDADARLYQVRADEEVRQQAEAWLGSMTGEEAVSALERGTLPAGMTMDVAQQAAGLLLQRTSDAMRSGNELLAMEARAIGNRAARVWQGWLSQEAGRSLRQRAVVNAALTPYAPILAAEGLLIDRADAVMNTRFEGGAEGATQKTRALADQAAAEGSADLAEDLNAETAAPAPAGAPVNNAQAQRRASVKQKHPSLKRMLDALRKKVAPGMTWAEIFMELPSAQKARQREIYRRLKLDQRLKSLKAEERLALTNELEKAWQQKRREVFRRELKRAGVLGEKDAVDRARVEKALPKLIRMINLGMMNSELWREAVAPQYGLRMLTNAEALGLRALAEEAYKEPPGLLQNRKLAALLTSLQKTTGVSRAELLNNYWVASVLSGLRTMFDTFMSVTNGLGTTAIQAASLALRRGNRRAALESLGQWFDGLQQGFRESMQILTKGDYSYVKRMNEDLRKALDGESSFRPLPLGEALWKDGNFIEKYGLAPVMIWTGRLLAAADHINNTATTQGAMAVARALHPEIYEGKAGFTAEEKAAAMAQAKREVLGGTDRIPKDKKQMLDLQTRQREILNGLLRPEDRQEASTIGDMAAYQNDPTGAFGLIYSGVSNGLGFIERASADYAATLTNRYAQATMLFLSGALRSVTGSKFIRFGANFGNDMLSYIPGTALAARAIVGRQATQSQRDLLVGKNVFGLVLSLGVASIFLGKDDEEEGWHIEGGWLDLNPDEVKARRAAGFEPFTFWTRDGDKVRRISYKQWPTAGIMAAVAHMHDRQRFAPEKWESEGMAGHLLAAATVGLFQVSEVAAMRGLAQLLGASRFGANPEEDFREKMVKLPVSFAGGFIPTPLKDFDLLADPSRYKPEGTYEELIRSVPLLRRTVNDGRPELNILGVPIQQDRAPWSRAYTTAEQGPAHRELARLMARGYRLSAPDTDKKVFARGAWTTIEALGAEAAWKYQKYVGDGYAQFLVENRDTIRRLDGDALENYLSTATKRIKAMAGMRVTDSLR